LIHQAAEGSLLDAYSQTVLLTDDLVNVVTPDDGWLRLMAHRHQIHSGPKIGRDYTTDPGRCRPAGACNIRTKRGIFPHNGSDHRRNDGGDGGSCTRRETEPRAHFGKNEPDCEPVHIFPACICYCLRAGDLRGPVIDAAGTRYFEPDGVVFCAELALPDDEPGRSEAIRRLVELGLKPKAEPPG
jgi:hypothetical protein